jgi:hypothetical protein
MKMILTTSNFKTSTNINFPRQPVLVLNLIALWINLAFPKAGIYWGAVPINIGYIVLGLGAFLVLGKILLRQYTLTRVECIALLLLSGNALFQLLTVSFFGSSTELSMAVGHFSSLAIVPPLALLSAGYVLFETSRAQVYRLMLGALVLIVIFGVINFLGLNGFKQMIGIPYVTFTGAEFDISTKYIDRGGVIKLISTYNNGNIFGINLLMWSGLILYGSVKHRRFFGRFTLNILNVLVKTVLLLTLSRTVWIAMIFSEVFLRFFVLRRLNHILSLFFVLAVLLLLVFGAANLFVRDPIGFIFDANLGARRSQLEMAWSFWPNQPFSGTVEIVYASMLTNFGLVGLVLFFVTWAWPALLPPMNYEGRLIQMGLFIYLLEMGADGAFIYVPTQATYWFLVAFAFNRFRVRPELKS